MKNFGYFMFLILSVVTAILLRGFVLIYLWEWFIVSVFSLPPLGFVNALGFSLIVHYLTQQDIDKKEDKDRDLSDIIGRIIGQAVFYPLLILLLGWFFTLFM